MLDVMLQNIGLTKNEAMVYLKLAELGKVRAGEIIDASGLHRNIVYTALEELEHRKLVTKMSSGKVFVFVANSLEALLDELEEKKEAIHKAAREIKKISTEESSNIAIYEGIEGRKTARNKMLRMTKEETMYMMGGSQLSTIPELENYWRTFHAKREKRGIAQKMLFDRSTDKKILNWRNSLPKTTAQYFPFSADLPFDITFCKDLVELGVYGKNIITFSLRSKELVDGFKKYFDYFWNQSVVVETGMIALEHAFYNMINELNPGEEYYVLGASTNTYDSDSGNLRVQTFFNDVHTKRIQKGVIVKMLAYREYVERGKQRFVDCGDPDGRVSFIKPFINTPRVPMQINLYNNKTIIIFYSETPTVLTFERPEMYEGFKAYFDSQWNQETYILNGPEALQSIWLESIDAGGIRFIGARGFFMDRYPELMKPVLEKMARSKNVYWKNIVDPKVRGHRLTTFPWSQTKYTLSNSKNLNVVWLWSNKVAIVNWAGDEPIILVSENKHLVQSYSDNFEELWKK